jgi:hypothetical protein
MVFGCMVNQAEHPILATSMRARLVPSRRLALLFVLALGALLGAALLARSARIPLRTPLVPRSARTTPLAVPLEGRDAPRGAVLVRAELSASDLAGLVSHEELQLFFESPAPARSLLRGEIRVRGRDCTLMAAPLDELSARHPVVFRVSAGCASLRVHRGPATLDLALEVEGRGDVSILAFVPSEGAAPAALQMLASDVHPTALDLRGALVSYPETAPRIVLLGHMWRNDPGPSAIGALVLLAIVLACAGCLLFPTERVDAGAPARATVMRGGSGAALLASCLALLYAVLAPPLSGPDEPYHLIGFAELVGDEALARDTVAWMGETHLWRIRQQPAERYRTIDVGKPYIVVDDQLRPTEVAMRSAIVARLWRAVGAVARGGSAHHALFALRLVNVLVFAFAVGAAAALALLLVAEAFPQWLVFPFLFVPALPFFATHVSETAVLSAVYVLLGASIGVIALDGPRAHWAGLALGLATGLMLAGGRSPWPLAPLVGSTLLGRALLSGCVSRAGFRAALVFWAGFGLGASVLFLAMVDEYRTMLSTYATYVALYVPAPLRGLGTWLLEHPAGALGLVLVGAALEVALGPLRQRFAAVLGSSAQAAAARAAAVLAVVVSCSLVGSLLFAYPQLPVERQYEIAAPDRLAAVLRTMATMFRLTQPDFQLASSFWVGFGWLDTMPGPRFQGLLLALVGGALVAWLLYLARHRETRRLAWLLLTATGLAGALVLYSLSTQGLDTALTGRYLIGWYLALLAVVAGALVVDHRPPRAVGVGSAGDGSARAAWLLLVAGSVHVYCLFVILQRYF